MSPQEMVDSPVALFIFILTIGTSLMAFNRQSHLYERFIFQPYAVARGRRLHTLLTHGLIHADGFHLLFNMITFYFFAFWMEQIWVRWAVRIEGATELTGHLYFLALYVIGLVVSCAGTLVKHRRDPEYLSLGASGAITALMFSFVLYAPSSTIYLFFAIPIPAPLFAVLYLVGSHYAAKHDRLSHINHDSHFWGALSGLAVTLLFAPQIYLVFFQYLRDLIMPS